MLKAMILCALRREGSAQRLRVAAVLVVLVVSLLTVLLGRQHPPRMVELLGWELLLTSIVAGGCLTGWSVAQFPKSRAAEFHLVSPAADWEIIGGELLPGMWRTLLVVGAATPVVTAVWGAGWISAGGATALMTIPIAGGWLAGCLLALIAYEPAWVRKTLERLVLVGILAYFIFVGLLGQQVLPRVLWWWGGVTGAPNSTWASAEGTFQYLNPFGLLSDAGGDASAADGPRTLLVLGLLLLSCAACFWRLSRRLRPHYDQENYGQRSEKGDRRRRLGEHPLSWWIQRRVSRFKGNVNLYLAWSTIGLYSLWLQLDDQWPAWLAVPQLRMLQHLGGGPLLAVAAVQLASVPVAFLGGLWDSNQQQRLGRLELLLVTPLAAGSYLRASAVAAWVRGRGYVLAALVMWMALAANGDIFWPACLGVSILALSYLLLCYAAAQRSFAAAGDDRQVTRRGLIWSVGMPLLTAALFQFDRIDLAAATPLGMIYLLAQPTAELNSLTGSNPAALWLTALIMTAALWIASALMTTLAARRFDEEIHAWFAKNLMT